MHLPLLLATIVAGVGAITGEKTVAQSVTENAAVCHAGTPVVGGIANNTLPVTVSVPGVDSLRCLAVRVSTETGRPRARIERLSCSAADRNADLTCELTLVTLEGYDAQSGRVFGILDAAVNAQLDATVLEILPDRIELAGDVPSEKARTDLETAAAVAGIPVRSFGLSVRAALDPEQMPELAKGDGPAQLHVAGLPAAAALSLAGDPTRPFVALAGGAPLSGRLAAANCAGLAKALAAAHPVKSIPVAVAGKYRKVDLSFQKMEAQAAIALVGDVMGLSVIAPRDLPPITAFTKGVPADAALAAMAKALGLTPVSQGGVTFLVPAGKKIRAPNPADKSRRSLNLANATAAEALSLLAAEGALPFCLPAGKPLTARIRNATITQHASALAVIDGATEQDAAACPAAPALEVKTAAELARLRLLATLTGGLPPRALVRKEDGSVAMLIGGTPQLSVTQNDVALKLGGESGELSLGVPSDGPAPASLRDHRLVATLVSPQGSLAVLEGRRGRLRILQNGWTKENGSVSVLPGSVQLTVDGYDPSGYRDRSDVTMLLRPRSP